MNKYKFGYDSEFIKMVNSVDKSNNVPKPLFSNGVGRSEKNNNAQPSGGNMSMGYTPKQLFGFTGEKPAATTTSDVRAPTPLFNHSVIHNPIVEVPTPKTLDIKPSTVKFKENNKIPVAKPTAMFDNFAESNEDKSHRIVCKVFLNSNYDIKIIEFFKDLMLEILVKGSIPLELLIKNLGEENRKMHDALNSYNSSYGLLNINEVIVKCNKMITEDYKFFERKINENDVVPHLTSIYKQEELFKNKLKFISEEAKELTVKVETLDYFMKGMISEYPTVDINSFTALYNSIKTSISLLLPHVKLLETETETQFENISRLFLVAIPSWKSSRK